MRKLPRGDELFRRCEALGIECSGVEIRHQDSGEHFAVYEHELQRKVIEVERSIREQRLWLVALVSAIASVVSAVAALAAVLAR